MPVDPTPNLAAFAAGHVPTATELDTWHDALNALSNTFTAYAPAWASSGTAVSLGNGTVVGKYSQIGKMVFFNITLTIGSSTTVGTGSYTLSLPVTALDVNWVAAMHFFDSSSAPSRLPGVAVPSTTSTLFGYVSPGGVAFVAGGQWSATVPSAPATGDKFIITGQYEAA